MKLLDYLKGKLICSLPSKEGNCDIAILLAVNGLDESQLGLFKDKKVELWFDQDDAGQKC